MSCFASSAALIICAMTLPSQAQTTGQTNVPKRQIIYELQPIIATPADGSKLPISLSTSIVNKKEIEGQPTRSPRDKEISWTADRGVPVFLSQSKPSSQSSESTQNDTPPNRGSAVKLDFLQPFVKQSEPEDRKVKVTATYAPSQEEETSEDSTEGTDTDANSLPPTVYENPREEEVSLTYLDFWIAETEESDDDVLIVRPTTAQSSDQGKKVIHWAKVVVKHSAPGELPLLLQSAGSKPLYFYGEQNDPNQLSEEPKLETVLEQPYANNQYFWVGTDAKGEGTATIHAQGNLGTGYKNAPEQKTLNFVPVEVVELSPKLKDETGTEIVDSNKPFAIPKANGMVEEDAANNRIAHRELKVRIGEPLKGKTVTWTMAPLFRRTPGPFPFEFRGSWTTAAASHRNRFEASTAYGANGFTLPSQESGQTTVGADGFTAIRVNVPPWGLNKARIRIQIEGTATPIDLIDLEVPGVIVIDPGHGIGAAGSSNAIGGSGDTTGVLEHEFALDVGTRMAADLRARRELEGLPIKIYMTRTGTGNMTFPDRTRIARENGCDVYVSIHFNAVDGVPSRRHPFGMWDSTDNHNLGQDQALAVRMRQALQRAIAAVEPEESRNAPTDGNSSETHEANLQKGLDTCSDSTNITTPNYNGNIPGHTPCRSALMELEWMSNNRADLLFNEGNSSLSSTANRMREEAAQAMADAAIEDLNTQPSQ
jgi:hypothetical protein